MDHRAFLSSIPPEARSCLTERSDRRGLRHLAGHLALIVAFAVWVGLALPFWPLALLPLGISLAFLFTLQHECTHRTPFESDWINEAVGHACGLILIQPFLWFRAFHLAHHRHTGDPDNDPELIEPEPATWRGMAWHLSAIGYWRAKAATLAANAGGPQGAYVPARKHGAIRREARLYLLAYAAAWASLIVSPILFWLWLLPLILGFPVLRLYLLAEHGRCPRVADMFGNTRTTLTSHAVRFIAWNMPYHAEHHAWPMVPFHALPSLHAKAAPHLKVTSDSYTRFARETAQSLRP